MAATPPAPPAPPVARGVSFIRTPMAVVVLASIELVLGVLTVGAVLQIQAARSNAGVDYVAVVAYASCAALAAALVLLGSAVVSSPQTRLRRLFRANLVFALAAGATAIGNLLANQVAAWTTPLTCEGCDPNATIAPSANQIAASVVVDLGAAALAALLPAIALLLLRNRRETAADHA